MVRNSIGSILLLLAIVSFSAKAEHATVSGSVVVSTGAGGFVGVRTAGGARYCAPPKTNVNVYVNPYAGYNQQCLTPTGYGSWGMPNYGSYQTTSYYGGSGWPYASYNYGSYTYPPTNYYGSSYPNNYAYNNNYNVTYNYGYGSVNYGSTTLYPPPVNPYAGYGYSQSYYNPWSGGGYGTKVKVVVRDGQGDVFKVKVRTW